MGRDGRQSVDEPSTGNVPAPAKRPYKAPRLRRLGSVRELTLGGTGGFVELGGGMKRTPR